MSIIGRVGRWAITKVSIVTGLLSLLYYPFVHFFRPRTKGRRFVYSITLAQIYFTGVQAVGIISVIALAIGAAIIFQVNALGVGQVTERLGQILVIVVVRELGPLLTAIIVIARSGTAIATEIANMVVKHETEALETMGIDTLLYIVLPRILGVSISMLFLNIYFDVVSVLGGVSVAKLLADGITYQSFFNNFFEYLTYYDILEFALKSLFFGAGVAVICVINGFKVMLYPGGVPVSGIKGVVGSLSYVFFVNVMLTVLFLI